MDYPCEHVVPIEEEPRHHLVIANQYVRAFAVEIAPRDRTLCHHHTHDYLLYVAGDAEIVSAARGEDPKRLSYRDGASELSAAGLTHVVENLKDEPFRNLVVELLPASGTLRRGVEPRWDTEASHVAGFEARVAPLFADPRAAIFKLDIELGAFVDISGPAVVAMPHHNKLTPEFLGNIEVVRNATCDFAWIPQQRQGALRARGWEHSELAIVFQIGKRSDEEGVPAHKKRDPLRSLRAHADEPK